VATPPIPVRTAEGQAELANRERRVSQRHRTVLFLIDGKRSIEQVQSLARQAGSADSCFAELVGLGLIDWAPAHDEATQESDAAHAIRSEVSLLPAAGTLQPESVLSESMLGEALLSESMRLRLDETVQGEAERTDPLLEEARAILLRAVRSEAPLAGSLTMLRLRRARSRGELAALIHEVEGRIVKPNRSLAAHQILQRARHLLASASPLPLSAQANP
jgi:hypothetical protein